MKHICVDEVSLAGMNFQDLLRRTAFQHAFKHKHKLYKVMPVPLRAVVHIFVAVYLICGKGKVGPAVSHRFEQFIRRGQFVDIMDHGITTLAQYLKVLALY